ncbi:MAG: hypothetical protein JG766_299 [Desulfacinum sp.]|jgi:PAS domain S-box-containing protein|nr:hypothetical protein [Desulfacinum sp.]
MVVRLRTKTILIGIGIFLLAIGSSTAVNGIYFVREYFDARKSETFVIAQSLKSQLDRILKMRIPLEQLEGFEVMCTEVVENFKFLSYAMVLDPQGKVLFRSDPRKGSGSIGDAVPPATPGSRQKTVRLFSMNGQAYYDFQLPVLGSHDEPVATIRIGFPRSFILNKALSLISYSAITATVFLLMGALLIFTLFDLWVTKPVENLMRSIENVRKGTWSTEKLADIKSSDELGQLAKAFREMMEDLQQTTVSRDFLDNIIESMLNSLIITDAEFRIRSVNRETTRMLGYSENELVGAPFTKIHVHPDASRDRHVHDAPPMETVKAHETSYRSKDGKEIPVLFSCSKIQTRDGEIEGYVCVAQDISEVSMLRGLLPICMVCKKIRDDQGYWNRIETYIRKHSKARFSHGICPDCAKERYPEIDLDFDELSES